MVLDVCFREGEGDSLVLGLEIFLVLGLKFVDDVFKFCFFIFVVIVDDCCCFGWNCFVLVIVMFKFVISFFCRLLKLSEFIFCNVFVGDLLWFFGDGDCIIFWWGVYGELGIDLVCKVVFVWIIKFVDVGMDKFVIESLCCIFWLFLFC